MSVVVTKMHDLASEFSTILRVKPPDPHSGRGDPLSTHPQPDLWLGVGHKCPSVGTQTLVPLNFSAVDASLLFWGPSQTCAYC